MKKSLIFGYLKTLATLLFAFFAFELRAESAQENASDSDRDAISIRVCSFNLRGSGSYDKGVKNWSHRKRLVKEFIESRDLDIIGTQESSTPQEPFFAEFMPQYASVGENSISPTDGRVKNLILYKKSRFAMLEGGTFWLSSTPDEKYSKDWDSSEPRAATYAKLRDKKTGKVFCFFSAHLDHKSELARMGQANVLFERLKKIAGNDVFICVGDFNMRPDSEPIKFVSKIENVKSAILEAKKNFATITHTFHGFKGMTDKMKEKEKDGEMKCIDYIFVEKSVEVLDFDICQDNEDGVYPSDHFPLVSNLKF